MTHTDLGAGCHRVHSLNLPSILGIIDPQQVFQSQESGKAAFVPWQIYKIRKKKQIGKWPVIMKDNEVVLLFMSFDP